jgi:hypothetical protein
MDSLLTAAVEYTKLLNKDFFYTLETGLTIKVYFIPGFFHHLLGLQKIIDIPPVVKTTQNSPNYIFRNILKGVITLEDIQKSAHFSEIEARLRHFAQINRLIEFTKIIIDFDPSLLISTNIIKADYVLFKRSNDNMYLNLFLKTKNLKTNAQIPLTFVPHITDYYTDGQKVINVVSMKEVDRTSKKAIIKKPSND